METTKNCVLLLLCGLSLVIGTTVRADVPMRGFTDFGYVYDRNSNNNSFQIHDVDLFVSGNVDKKVSYVAEINFQPAFDGVSVDLERSYAQYFVNPWFKVAVGRFHTALGYWNDTYHHGAYLYTPATRPLMERFEDSGGLLPMHNTGIEIRGNGPMGSGNFGYIFNIGNGRGPVKDPPTFFNSYSKSKSVSGVAYYEMPSGLRVGGNFWRSDLPGGCNLNGDSSQNTAACGPTGAEWIYGAHVVLNTPEIEWITEYEIMLHHYFAGSIQPPGTTNAGAPFNNGVDGLGSKDTTIHLLYSQFGYHVNEKWTPYVRYELDSPSAYDAYLNASPGYVGQGLPATMRQFVVGARYELSPGSALKFEATYMSSGAPIYLANTPNPSDKMTDYQGNINWSFAF